MIRRVHNSNHHIANQRCQRIAALCVVSAIAACTGNIGGDVTQGSRVPNPLAEAQQAWSLPLRGLTPYELRNTLFDLFGDDGREVATMQPLVIATGVETTGEDTIAWGGSRADQLEVALYGVATRLVSPGGSLAACAQGSGSECVKALFDRTAPLLYRRAVTPDEMAALVSIVTTNEATLGRKEALARALEAAVMSADTLYLTSIGGSGAAAAELTPLELAGRLSYTLWSSAPDKALLNSALSGELVKPAILEAQAKRMLADPRGRRGLQRFVLGWAGILNLRSRTKGVPEWTGELASDGVAETERYLQAWLERPAADIGSLFLNPTSYVTPALAQHYGVVHPGGPGLQPIIFPASARRAGLLSQMSFLAASTAAASSSPTLRGRWVMERALCRDQPPPPPDTVSNGPKRIVGSQTREYHELLENNTACAGCHKNMETAGYPFEIYDGLGRLRLTEESKAVRNNSTLAAGKDLDGTYDGELSYFAAFAKSDSVAECMSEHLLSYALGRRYGKTDEALRASTKSQIKVDAKSALIGVVTSKEFRTLANR